MEKSKYNGRDEARLWSILFIVGPRLSINVLCLFLLY